jgi:RsiW-degrading membrane proteinase PrsW (M82 family)
MKPTFIIWSLSAPVLAGAFITALLLMPSMAPKLGLWIVLAAAVSALITVPFSMAVSKALQ